MKNVFIFIAICTSFMTISCSQKNSSPHGSMVSQKGIVLGAFTDITTPSTLDESKLQDLPKIVNFSDIMTSVKDQSNRGTCTFFAVLGALEGALKKDTKIDANFSEEYLIYETKKVGDHYSNTEESAPSLNVRALIEGGLMLERDWSYQPSWFDEGYPCEKFVLGAADVPAKCISHNSPDNKALKKIISVNDVYFKYLNKNTNDIIRFLATEGRPLVIGLTVNLNGWPKDTGDTIYNEELRAECLKTPSACGGHTVVLTGYDMNKKVFFFKNSWGLGWGNKGYGTVTFDTVDKYVKDSLLYVDSIKVDLPKDYAKDYLNADTLEVTPTLANDNSIEAKIRGQIQRVDGRTLIVSSSPVLKLKQDIGDSTDENTLLIPMPNGQDYVKSFKAFSPSAIDSDIIWTEEAPLTLQIGADIMKQPDSVKYMNASLYNHLLKTSVYVHTDDQTYKVIKEVYLPLEN